MAEGVESRQANPLSTDPELLRMYLGALDTVLGAPDIRRSFDEFGLSAGILRIRMVRDAEQVLKTAAREFAAYQGAVTRELSAHAVDLTAPRRERLWKLVEQLRNVAGLWQELIRRLIITTPGVFGNTLVWDLGSEVAHARSRLMAAITETELLAQVRTFINTARQSRFGHRYSVASSPALSEVYDGANRVPTRIESELAGLLDRLDGASIGVAGPRGAGKSTLVRGYCEEADPAPEDHDGIGWSALRGADLPGPSWGDLRCMVSAPVDYVARDFVLHLFASFCGEVISGYSKAGRFRHFFLTIFWAQNSAVVRGFDMASCTLWQLCGNSVVLEQGHRARDLGSGGLGTVRGFRDNRRGCRGLRAVLGCQDKAVDARGTWRQTER